MKTTVEYDITLDFKPGSKNPSRIFTSLANIIESVKATDQILAKSINCKSSTVQILDDVKFGSIQAKIKEFIEVEEDTFCTDKTQNKVQTYFDKSKKEIIKSLSNGKIEKKSEIELLAKSISLIADDIGLSDEIGFKNINQQELLQNLKDIADSTNNLIETESISYTSSDEEKIVLSPKTRVFIEEIKNDMIDKRIESTRPLILKIKKPDYLGHSKWDFKHNKTKVSANIEDDHWMNDFHNRRINIGPGDSLEVSMHTVDCYDSKGNLINTENVIIEVKDIIYAEE